MEEINEILAIAKKNNIGKDELLSVDTNKNVRDLFRDFTSALVKCAASTL